MEDQQTNLTLPLNIVPEVSAPPSSGEASQMDLPSPSTRPSASTSTSCSDPISGTTPTPTPENQSDELPKLTDDQEEVMTSELLDPIKINFTKGPEVARELNKSKIVPPFFYRTGYETSVTLSAFTSKDTHAKHREQPKLKISNGNAFQAICKFRFRNDLNRERIERQLKWNKRKDPSSYISVFNKLSHAERRANFHYKKSHRIGQRVFIAKISTQGLVAATVSAKCRTTVVITTKRKWHADLLVERKVHEFDVDIPVWICDPRKPKDRVDLSYEEFAKLNAEMWISIKELRQSNLKDGPKSRKKVHADYICAAGHSYEWLACGTIPKARVVSVMPFDGQTLFTERTTRIIRSLDSTEPWVWNWDQQRWVLDAALFRLAEWREAEMDEARKARKRVAGEAVEQEPSQPSKRPKLLEVTLVRPYLKSTASRKANGPDA